MSQSTQPISPLRQRMIDDMSMRKLAPATQRNYLRAVERFTRYFRRSPDQADAEDLRRFQLHLATEGVSRTNTNQILTGLRFFSAITLSRPEALACAPSYPTLCGPPCSVRITTVWGSTHAEAKDLSLRRYKPAQGMSR